MIHSQPSDRPGCRFLHISQLRLDAVPDRLAEFVSGPNDPLFSRLLGASFSLWDRVVEECMVREVGFLLLDRNTLDDAQGSFRARLALREGLEELDAEGIVPVIIPGETDPIEAWHSFFDLPTGTVIFDASKKSTLVVSPAGETPAKLVPLTKDVLRRGSDEKTPLIGVPIDSPTTDHVGIAYATSAGGSQSCAVVEVASNDNSARTTALQLAPVRCDEFHVTINNDTTSEDLVETMWSHTEHTMPDGDESCWLITWRIAGCGGLYANLHDEQMRERFLAEVAETITPEKVTLRQRVRFQPDARSIDEGGDLWNAYHALISVKDATADPVLTTPPPPRGFDRAAWQKLIADCDPTTILELATDSGFVALSPASHG